MNKGFEAIEAHHLFGVPYERIEVVVHPQSIVHSLIDLNRRRLARPPRPPRHAGADLLRAPLPRAGRRRRAAARPRRGRRAELRGARPRDLRLPAPGAARPARPAAPRPASSTPPTRSRSPPSSTGGSRFTGDRRGRSSGCSRRCPRAPVAHFEDLFADRRRGPRAAAEERSGGWRRHELAPRLRSASRLLIILHEAGHFVAAKATGMRVERFFLFFPPKSVSVKRGETEYGIGAIPLGGFVKITGMNPDEELPPEIAHRGYYHQPVWKRIVVIGAGPAVNIVLAFLILFVLFTTSDVSQPTRVVAEVTADPRRRQARRRATGSSRSTGAPPRPAGDRSKFRSTTPHAAPASRATAASRRPRPRLTIERDGARADLPRAALLRRRDRPQPDRLRLRRSKREDLSAGEAAGSLHRPDVVIIDEDGRASSPTSSTPNSASRSPASSASYDVDQAGDRLLRPSAPCCCSP